MARGGTGRWVARAAATGGGRTYRGQAPVRWYASLVLIVLLGVALVSYSRYELYHPAAAAQPAVGTKWYTALGIYVCGALQPNLPANPGSRPPAIHTKGDGIIYVQPTTGADAGSNATLGRFALQYRGLTLTSSSLRTPGSPTYRNGATCPKGTPQAGRTSYVQVKMWPSFSGAGSNNPVTVSDPRNLKLSNGQLITVAFAPRGASIPKPSSQTIATLLNLVSGTSSTSTTLPSTSATAPSTTAPPTTAPSTTTSTP